MKWNKKGKSQTVQRVCNYKNKLKDYRCPLKYYPMKNNILKEIKKENKKKPMK